MTSSSRPVAVRVAPTRPTARVAWWRRVSLRDVVVVSMVPVLAIALLFVDAAVRYSRTIQFDDWWSARASVAGMFSDRVRSLATLPSRVALRQRFDAEANDATVIRLDVAGNDWNAMQSDPLAGWGTWVDATLGYGKTSIDVRIRKRGDNSVHWLTDKRTMTVRTPRDQFYKRYRSFGLSVKDVVSAYLANKLAGQFGLLAATTEVVPLFVNNQFYGVFRFIETIDESMLRPFDRMPGNIFRGDRAERGDYWKGVQRNLFDNPTLWDRVAMNDRWTSAGSGQLALAVADLHGGGFADHQRLMNRFDREELGRLFAYLLIVGDPYHMDGVHNQFIYEDPSTQRLHFIPWDIRVLDLKRPAGVINDLFQEMLRDPLLVDEVLRQVRDAAGKRGIARVADSLARAVERRQRDYLRYDRLRDGLIPEIGTGAAAVSTIQSNLAILERWSQNDTVAVAVGSANGIGVVDLETRGFAGVDLTGFDGARPVRVVLDSDLDGALGPGDREVPQRPDSGGVRLAQPVGLLPGWSVGRGIVPGTMPYRLFLVGPAGLAPRPRLRNRLTDAPATTVPWASDAPIGPPSGWHPWRYPVARPVTHRLAGSVRLDSTLRIALGDTLVIEPGTTIRMAPDVSIVSRGVVLALGRADRPIRFVPADDRRPWGTVALLEHGADGSRFRHVEFLRGGGALVDRIEYIGMVNVHRVTGAVFDSVAFIENLRSDDTFHALHAEVALLNCRFVRANSDAADFDISTGEVRNTRFEGSGGDAIDLMTSTPLVIGNSIDGAGDKGISVGEASRPFVFGNRITNSVTGIEIKDKSTPVVMNTEIRGVTTGIAARAKNWRYGGSGFGFLTGTVVTDAKTPLKADDRARFTFARMVGIDSVPPAAFPRWLYAAHGLEVADSAPGVPARWRPVAPVGPVGLLRFEDDFGAVADGWVGTGRITRLEKRHDVLVAETEGGSGTIQRAVDWDLTAAGGEVVFELAGRDLARGRVVVETDRGQVVSRFEGSERLDRFRLVSVAVPPSKVRRLAIELEPTPGLSHVLQRSGLYVTRAARLDLRSVGGYPNGSAKESPR